MKQLIIVFLFLCSSVYCQSQEIIKVRKPKIDLVGVWNLTFISESYAAKCWEFKTDGVFNVLEGIQDGDTILVPDENGTWLIKGDKLIITITGEATNGKQKLYEKPQVLEFDVINDKEEIILKTLDRRGKLISLLITRKTNE